MIDAARQSSTNVPPSCDSARLLFIDAINVYRIDVHLPSFSANFVDRVTIAGYRELFHPPFEEGRTIARHWKNCNED